MVARGGRISDQIGVLNFAIFPEILADQIQMIGSVKKSSEDFNEAQEPSASFIEESPIEKVEGIELMRALENEMKIGTFKINKDIFSVDIKKDYLKSKKLMPFDKLRRKY